ncbi:hypothetical protein BBI15_05620 [Planococcus plakortidis]|uniref:NgoFVII family restriction endonuclease n=1 Tax=Planococcus plakortidis TaxID=1038856 RepID=A0A1C7E7R2_9BACL|nr:DUF881 domain-containing protein [Planococcus plakortidis]ANU19721.1 hypothetical protein BBI15_05620 [Planococcus plakortidis]
MKKRITGRFTVILFVIGFMSATQYNTVNMEDSRDSRDTWEIRQQLSREKQVHSELLSEISLLDDTLGKYSDKATQDPEAILKETVEDLRVAAGLTQIRGPGVELEISPSLEAVALGTEITEIPPDLLIRLVNEINRFESIELSIAGERVINTTAIRDINGYTTVNADPISTPPFTIGITAESMEEARKLSSYLTASAIHDDFYIDDLTIAISEPQEDLELPAFDEEISMEHLEAGEGE